MAWKFSVLVVANVTAASDELLAALKTRADRDRCAFTLLVPATGGGKAGREAAEAQLGRALERMRGADLEVEGMVGDADPVIAVNDVWDPRRFDEIVISTLPTGASRWLAVDLPHRVEKFTGVQVEHVVAAEPRPPARTEPAPEHEHYGVLSPLAAITGKRNAT
jgi:hypothetical protein